VLVHCHAGCNQRDVYVAIRRLTAARPGTHSQNDRVTAEDDADALKHAAYALAIWHRSQQAAATLVQAYLAARGINLPPKPIVTGFIPTTMRPGVAPEPIVTGFIPGQIVTGPAPAATIKVSAAVAS
jgi:hypothetical protein